MLLWGSGECKAIHQTNFFLNGQAFGGGGPDAAFLVLVLSRRTLKAGAIYKDVRLMDTLTLEWQQQSQWT